MDDDAASAEPGQEPVGVDYRPFESPPFPEVGEGEPGDAPEWANDAMPVSAAFDIDDQGRRETLIPLRDGTRLHLIQQILVDWTTGTGVNVVLRGWLNRRTTAGRLPGNSPYTLRLAHTITYTTRKMGRTNPPIDFAPMSNGTSGFYLVSANLNYGAFQSEWYAAQSNSLTLHYSGAWMLRATGEPRDNPIDRIGTQVLTRLSNGNRATSVYAARRGGS